MHFETFSGKQIHFDLKVNFKYFKSVKFLIYDFKAECVELPKRLLL